MAKKKQKQAYDFDPYVVLGVSRTASEKEIKRAYHKLAQRLHPDKNHYRAASNQFQRVNEAHDLLTDSIQRRKYDEYAAKLNDEENPGYVTMRVTPSKRNVVPLDEPQVIYLLAEISPPPNAKIEDQKAAPLNITLVIDQSNSMQDENRMTKVRAAAHALINQLTPDDILSVVSFNDDANVIIEAQRVTDPGNLKARLQVINPSGATQIYKGLEAGVEQNKRYGTKHTINHVILLTDGRTYGDEDMCIALAQRAKDDGITISTMGLGTDWNDKFLDKVASVTGSHSTFVRSINTVSNFMDDRLRSLSNAYAERLTLSVAPDPGIDIERAFKLTPSPQPLTHEDGIIPLGSVQAKRPITVLLQFELPAHMTEGYNSIARLVISGDILENAHQAFNAVSDLTLHVTNDPPENDVPPNAIVDALSKLTLYNLQEKAQDAMDRGDVDEATRRLENLATRLLDMGESSLARQVMSEAKVVKQTSKFSNEERKLTIKYGTRALLGADGLQKAITSMMTNSFSNNGSGDNSVLNGHSNGTG